MPPREKKESIEVILARIEERLNNHINNVESDLKSILEEAKKTNGRVSRLEVFKNKIQGAWAMVLLVAAGSGTVAAILVSIFRG